LPRIGGHSGLGRDADACTDGGRERTIDDYSALAADADLQVTAVHAITERYVIIECVPV
jgi:hypothetical protein